MSQLDAEGVVETGGSSDEINTEGWLKSKGLESVTPILQQAGLTVKELLLCSEEDIRDLCKEYKISVSHRIKLIAALKETPGSAAAEKQKIVFLGDKEKEILDQSFKKTEVIAGDIKSIRAAIIDLEESAVECTKEVQSKSDVLISMITEQRDSLLTKITELKTERKSELETMLNRLQAVNESAITAQKECKKIAVKADVATSSRLEQMETVLKRQEEAESKMKDDDDQKETESKASDIKLAVIYDEKAFTSALDTVFNVGFNEDELDLKYDYGLFGFRILKFSTEYKSSAYLTLSDDNRCVKKVNANDHRYILADIKPVTKGIHCWRIQTKNPNNGWIMWGVSPRKSFADSSWNDKSVFGAATSNGCYYNRDGLLNNPTVSQFNVAECEVDMLVDIEGKTWSLCVVGQNDDNHTLKYTNCNFSSDGIVPHFNPHVVNLELRIAKIPPEEFGIKREGLFK